MFKVRTFNSITDKLIIEKEMFYKAHAIAYAIALERDYLRDPHLVIQIWDDVNDEVVDY